MVALDRMGGTTIHSKGGVGGENRSTRRYESACKGIQGTQARTVQGGSNEGNGALLLF